jgi:hypothetical protein
MRIPLLIGPIFLGCFFMAIPNNVQAPGSEDLRKLYGEPTMERFTARPGITVTIEYGPDRLACQLLIEPARLLVEVRDEGPLMSSRAISEILQEVVPPNTRGKQIDATSVQIERNKLLRTDCENVSIRRICSVASCASSAENQDLRALVVFTRQSCPKHIE